MNIQALFKVQCGLFVAAVGTPEKVSGCITNTLMQQSHVPVKLSLTIEKTHLTHDLIVSKRSVAVSALSSAVTVDYVKRFGFVSGREAEKFQGYDDYAMDGNGNPLLKGAEIAATYALTVYETVDVGTHTMFLCTCDDAQNADGTPITYWDYRAAMKK